MEKSTIDLLMNRFNDMLPEETHMMVYRALENLPEERSAFIYTLKMKNPNVAIGLNLLGFLMFAGFDKFYLGEIRMGLLKLFTLGGFFIWTIYDLFTLKKRVKMANFNKLMSKVVKKTYVGDFLQNLF